MQRWFPLTVALVLASARCRSRETRSLADPVAPVSGPASASASVSAAASSVGPAPSGSGRPPTGLAITLVKPEVATFALRHATGSRLGPHGWLGTEDGNKKYAYDLAFASPTDAGAPRIVRAPRLGVPHLVTTRTKAFAWYEEHDRERPQLFAIGKADVKLVAGALPGEWAFDLSDGRTLVVGTEGGKMSVAARWHVSVLGPDGPRVVGSATGNESAWGAAALGDGFVVAVREPIAMGGATLGEKVSALQGVLRGDGEEAEQLAEPARGALLYLDREGRITKREPIGPQRPVGLATTEHGWLVVLGEGTLRKGLRDAVLIARGPDQPAFRLLASDIDTPNGLRQRGNWSCLTEHPSKDGGENYIVHCFAPERGLHVATPPIGGIVSINDIELGPRPRVWVSRHRYSGEPADEVLTIALP